MDNENFWKGMSLVLTGLAEATKQASYSVGLGAGGLGATLLVLERFGIDGVKATIISMSAFFIAARIGKAIDDYVEQASLRTQVEREREIKKRIDQIEEYQYNRETENLLEIANELERFLNKYDRIIGDGSDENYKNVFREMSHDLTELIGKLKNDNSL